MKCLLYVSMLFLLLSSFAKAHETPPPHEIVNDNPRLERHYNEVWKGEELHLHWWCYGVEQDGWFQISYLVSELPKDPDPEPDPEPVVNPEPEPDPEPDPVVDPEPDPDPIPSPMEMNPGEQSDAGNGLRVMGDGLRGESGLETPPTGLETPPTPLNPPPADIVLTQVMFHTWGAIGGRDLPQWLELHNRGRDANLKGYTLTFRINIPFQDEEKVIVLKDFPLPAGETMIVTRRRVGGFLGHLWGHSQGVKYVYVDEQIPNLKNKWTLTDPSGKVVYRRDAHWNYGWGHHKNRERCAVDVIPSEPYTGDDGTVFSEGARYYGSRWDACNPPGFHIDVAPQAPQLRRPKQIGTWGNLKRHR